MLDENSPRSSLAILKSIKQRGVEAAMSSVNSLLDTTEGAIGFSFLIQRAKDRENQALSKLDPQYLPPEGQALDLNTIVTDIDNKFHFSELLAGGAIERYIQDQGYILEAKGAKSQQNKTDDEKNESLVTVLSPAQQEEIINYIGNKFTSEILSDLTAKTGSNFISDARGVVLKRAGEYFQQMISSKVGASGMSLNNIDLGHMEVKINTRGLYLKMGKKISDTRVMIDASAFQITSAGEFFDAMTPIAQQLLYAIVKDEENALSKDNKYLKQFIEKYNSRDNIKYLQDLDVESSMNLIRQALSSECPEALDAFNKYGREIAYKGAKANLRGGLGELRSLCILEKMFPGQGYSAAGLSKVIIGTSSEKESPIDAILQLLKEQLNIGIQSKNTNKNIYSGWKVDKKEAMSMPNFYSQRLNQGLSGAEEIFFNTLSYNQPIESKGPYAKEWNSFINNPAFINKFNALVYKIIRQEIEDTSQVVYINDFFFMNDKIIRSSDILIQIQQNVISRLGKNFSPKTNSDFISTDFNYFPNHSLVWTKERGYDDNGYPIFSAGSAANVMINYSISLNINKMASMAISSFNP